MSLPLCKECGVKNANRPRGLCWHCYYTPGMLAKHPSTSKYANRGVGNGNISYRRPAAPTRAIPGSEEKIMVMIERLRERTTLDHPGDLKLRHGRVGPRGAFRVALPYGLSLERRRTDRVQYKRGR